VSMMSVLYSSAPRTAEGAVISPFDAAAAGRPPGRPAILTSETCDAAATATAARLVCEFRRLATSPREHDKSVAAFFLNEITCVIEARRKVQSEVCARSAPRMLARLS